MEEEAEPILALAAFTLAHNVAIKSSIDNVLQIRLAAVESAAESVFDEEKGEGDDQGGR